MEDGDNSLIDSFIADSVCDNIFAEGTGCYTVAGTTANRAWNDRSFLYPSGSSPVSCEPNGLNVYVDGAFNVINSRFYGNYENGISAGALQTIGVPGLCLSVDGVMANDNKVNGINLELGVVGLDIKNSEVMSNGSDGLDMYVQGPQNVVIADSRFFSNDGDGVSEKFGSFLRNCFACLHATCPLRRYLVSRLPRSIRATSRLDSMAQLCRLGIGVTAFISTCMITTRRELS